MLDPKLERILAEADATTNQTLALLNQIKAKLQRQLDSDGRRRLARQVAALIDQHGIPITAECESRDRRDYFVPKVVEYLEDPRAAISEEDFVDESEIEESDIEEEESEHESGCDFLMPAERALPGEWVPNALACIVSPSTMDRVLLPAIWDMQCEYLDALDQGASGFRRLCVRVRGYVSICQALGLGTFFRVVGTIGKFLFDVFKAAG